MRSVLGQSPPLTGVLKGRTQIEAVEIVDEAGLVFPGQLDHLIFRDHDTFTKVFWIEVPLAHDGTGIQSDLSDPGLSASAGAFIEKTLVVKQPLGERIRVVR